MPRDSTNDRCLRSVGFPAHTLVELLNFWRDPTDWICRLKHPEIPPDSEVINVGFDNWERMLIAILWHPSFSPCTEGESITRLFIHVDVESLKVPEEFKNCLNPDWRTIIDSPGWWQVYQEENANTDNYYVSVSQNHHGDLYYYLAGNECEYPVGDLCDSPVAMFRKVAPITPDQSIIESARKKT